MVGWGAADGGSGNPGPATVVMLHDVLPDGRPLGESGFTGPGPDRYKIRQPLFEAMARRAGAAGHDPHLRRRRAQRPRRGGAGARRARAARRVLHRHSAARHARVPRPPGGGRARRGRPRHRLPLAHPSGGDVGAVGRADPRRMADEHRGARGRHRSAGRARLGAERVHEPGGRGSGAGGRHPDAVHLDAHPAAADLRGHGRRRALRRAGGGQPSRCRRARLGCARCRACSSRPGGTRWRCPSGCWASGTPPCGPGSSRAMAGRSA